MTLLLRDYNQKFFELIFSLVSFHLVQYDSNFLNPKEQSLNPAYISDFSNTYKPLKKLIKSWTIEPTRYMISLSQMESLG